ncbi:MAG: glycosyltransferase [Candidatus Cyclobacteriaceae bacterium M3_2C_046]
MDPVTFYYPFPDDLKNIEKLNINEPHHWSTRINSSAKNWILQTFLRLKSKNYNVQISDSWPQNGIVVLHSDKRTLNALNESYDKFNKDLLIVTVRADRLEWRPLLSDAEILQNGKFINNKDSFFIPFWPQIGIIPRNKERNTSIKNIVFKGGYGSLDENFHKKDWHTYLKERNINFILTTEKGSDGYPNWYDYSEADIVLAVRPQFGDKGFRSDKPASKLVNSWHAQVPAILGAEYAFRELRKSELDYLEAKNVNEAIEAVEFLLKNPSIYQDMIENGKIRAKEFSADQIAEIWADTLFTKVPKLRENKSFRISREINAKLRKPYHLLTKPQSLLEYRKWMGSIYRNIKGIDTDKDK